MPIMVPIGTPRRVRNPIPAKFVETFTKETRYLINITGERFVLQRTYGVFVIDGCKEDNPYTVTRVNGRLEMMDEGDQKYGQQLTEAELIAEDLCNEINSGILTIEGGDSRIFMGVFVSMNEEPSENELKTAHRRLENFYKDQVAIADVFWDDPANHKNISSLQRRAARYLNMKKPWTYDSTPQVQCAACGESLAPGVAICKTCHAIQPGMEDAARKFFPERFSVTAHSPEDVAKEATGELGAKVPARKTRSAS